MMNAVRIILVWLIATCPLHAEQPSSQRDEAKSQQAARHAYFTYTAALSEDDNATRMKLFTRAVEMDPTLYRAYYNRGVLHARNNDLKDATADFLKSIELNPNYIYAHYNLACMQATSDRKDKALTSLDQALKKGYRKFDKLMQDKDLSRIVSGDEFLRLIARYEELAKANPETPLQKIQTGSVSQRAEILVAAIEKPTRDDAYELADWGMYEPDERIRVLAMKLWRAIDHKESRQRLAVGLYDVNGYVRKAAANALIDYGKDIAETVIPIVNDMEFGVAFFAMQILAKIDARDSADAIVPHLKANDSQTRIMAAQCLAQLQAASALPSVKAALETLPKDREQHDVYKLSIRQAIEAIERASIEKRE